MGPPFNAEAVGATAIDPISDMATITPTAQTAHRMRPPLNRLRLDSFLTVWTRALAPEEASATFPSSTRSFPPPPHAEGR